MYALKVWVHDVMSCMPAGFCCGVHDGAFLVSITGYLNKPAPEWGDLDFIRNPTTREKFELAKMIGSIWSTIGSRLRIEPNLLDCMMDEERNNGRCLQRVFDEWFSNAPGMKNHKLYPLSWQGLRTLLEDCDKEEIARKYFDFLSQMPI